MINLDEPALIDEILDLAKDLEPHWPTIRARIPAWHPRMDGEGEGDGDGEGGDGDGDGDGDGEGGEGGNGDETRDSNYWKRRAHRSEKKARTRPRRSEEAQKKLQERDEATKSEHEKAIEAARKEERESARKEADTERRADRLESATIRLASRGFTVKDEDGKDQTLRFADPDDAHTYVERMLRRGDLDEDELFDENGKIQNDALTAALQELLETKPHLVANGNGTGRTTKVSGSADGGKGSGGGKSKTDLSTEEQFERMRQHK